MDNLRISSTSFLSVFNVLRMYYACSTQDFCNAGGTLGLSAFVKQATSHLALKPPRVLNASPFFPILHIKEVASSSALRDFVGNLSPPFP